MDIPSFLRMHPPFDDLTDEMLEQVVRATHIEFFPQGQVILQQGGEPARHLYIVRTGAVELVDVDHVVDRYAEGEVFGYVSLLTGSGPAFTIRAHEETICYLVDEDVSARVLATRRGLALLSNSVRSREQRALASTSTTSSADVWAVPLRSLILRSPVTISPGATIRDAARVMTDQRISSVLVDGPAGWAILTDRDLRSKVLAEDRSPHDDVEAIVTRPIVTIDIDAPAAEALSLMLERGIHHVPVTDGDDHVVGIVTDTDLMAVERRSAFMLRSGIERAADPEGAIAAAGELPRTVSELVDGSVDPLEIGHVVAVTVDTLTERLLDLAIERHGDPPSAWAWLSLGSEARQEQGLATDQDNALAYDVRDGDPDAIDAYFASVADEVNTRLSDAGIPRCRAGVIAANREWRGSIDEWRERFRGWIADPGRTGSAFTGIAFDYRPIAGSLEVRPELDAVIRQGGEDPDFLRHLGRHAIEARPPTGFVKDGVIEARGTSSVTLDVKRSGIALITNLARVYALRSGTVENRTVRRLRGAVQAGRLEEDMAEGLEEAFRLLWQVRLEHQVARVGSGAPPDDEVDPRQLGPLARQGLREAFRMIERAQQRLAVELGLRW